MPIPQQKEPTERTTAKERIYRTLSQWIIDGTLEPDERLNDVELAQYFSVSRTPVREALQLLSEQKLVHIVPSSGTYVAPVDPEDMRYVYELLGGLQALALEAGIARITPEDLAHLTALNDTFLKCADSGRAAAANEADFKFHHYLCELAGNPYLIAFSDQLSLQARRNENRFFKEYARPQDSYAAHGRILEALRTGDLARAQQEIRGNWTISIPAPPHMRQP